MIPKTIILFFLIMVLGPRKPSTRDKTKKKIITLNHEMSDIQLTTEKVSVDSTSYEKSMVCETLGSFIKEKKKNLYFTKHLVC